jgi:hypothetical protein
VAIWDAVESGVDAVVGAAEDAGNAIVDAVEDAVDAAVDIVDAVAAAVDEALAAIGDVVEQFGEAVAAAVDAVADAMGEFGAALAKGIEDLVDAVESVTEWIVDKVGDLGDWVVNDLVPFVHGLIKLAVVLAILIATAPAFLLAMFICTQIANAYGEEYGTVLQAIMAGYDRYVEMFRIRRLPAGGRYVIVSDLHRYATGDLDIPTQQDDIRLYQGVLEHYAKGEWSLIENGDVEDFWLRGGSGWGVAYDVASGFTGPAADVALDAGMAGIAELHLANVVGNPHYARVYAMLRSLYHDKGRYFRTCGNHDDVYRSEQVVGALGRYFPGIRVDDFIVFDAPSGPVGLVAHGHQTDAWNSGACAFLGRFTTSVVSAINDVLPDSKELGVPGADSVKMWDGEGGNTLTDVSPLIGVTLATDSLDEPILHGAYVDSFGGGADGPWLILGHTHAPRIDAWDDDSDGNWARYLNDGAVLFPQMLTAVEWDGTADADNPTLSLVGWRYGATPGTVARAVITRSGTDKLRAGDKEEFAVQSL